MYLSTLIYLGLAGFFSTGSIDSELALVEASVISSDSQHHYAITEKSFLDFAEFHQGDLAFSPELTFDHPRFQVIRTTDDLNTLYKDALTDSSCADCVWEPLQEIDFQTSMVVLVAHEIVGSGGYSINIEGMVQTGDQLKIDVVKSTPGQNCMATMAFTGPYKLYKISGHFDEVDFVERVVPGKAC